MPAADRTRWNARWQERAPEGPGEPSRALVELAELLPRQGRALDAAGGAGRHALWLKARGLDVTLVDVSDVAVALARQAGIAEARVWDLEEQGPPAGPWDLILSFHYLHRPLYPAYAAALAPGGRVVIVQPTKRNLERHPRPPADYLLDEGELPGLIGDLQVVHYDEGWLVDGRHEARLVAERR